MSTKYLVAARGAGPSAHGLTSNDREWWQRSVDAAYRMARWHLRNARRYANALDVLYQVRGAKRRKQDVLDAFLDSCKRAAEWREDARYWRRARDERFPATRAA